MTLDLLIVNIGSMPRRIIIYPYKLGSRSAKALAQKLRENGHRVLIVRPDGVYVNRPSDIVINWGSTRVPNWNSDTILNKFANVAKAVDKVQTFLCLEEADVRHVPFTTSQDTAMSWDRIVERRLTRAYGGRGIVISTPSTIGRARLYTELLSPSEEYRVHVFRGEVIDYSKKLKRVNDAWVGMSDETIKNHENGWVFIRDVGRREGVIKRAVDAVNALGLDFGSVDVLRHNNKSYVLEVGTACGLSDIGVTAYANKIEELLNNN